MFKQSRIPEQKYFIRQRYSHDTFEFTSLKHHDLQCSHKLTPKRPRYHKGDCILVRHGGNAQPAIFIQTLDSKDRVRLFQLRKWYDKSQAIKPNELLLSDKHIDLSWKNIIRKCHVKYMRHGSKIPTPYDRDGQGDCFFVSYLYHENRIAPFDMDPSIFNQDFDLDVSLNLPCLSLFSGGGNFDRGIQEGGAFRTICAVEWEKAATNTFEANAPEPVNIFHGSVDVLLKHAIKGLQNAPWIGQIFGLIAGSPCQGYSMLQKNVYSDQSLSNASKIASVAAYIDHYRPAYAILENVVTLSRPIKGNQSKTALAELTCALVGMGYQVQQFILAAH